MNAGSPEETAYSELAIPGYAANPPDRCYLCKGELFRRLSAMARVLAGGLSDEVVRRVRAAGFAFVALDLEGLRSGSLNRLLPTP